MDLDQIRRHWEDWSRAGTDLAATTRTSTIKTLEIDAVARAIRRHHPGGSTLLEAGCGNGHNLVGLARAFAHLRVDGFDYIDAMAAGARELAEREGLSERVRVFAGNILATGEIAGLGAAYDIVLSDRMLINLNSEALQERGVLALAALTKPGGLLLVLENFIDAFEHQNDAREAMGLSRRRPAEFNLFMDAERTIGVADGAGLRLLDVDEFGSLHDLLLYVLIPAVNGGKVEYDHPLVAHAAELSATVHAREANAFGAWGQNRLYAFAKPD
jgi:SAM-dependent methyltransferase